MHRSARAEPAGRTSVLDATWFDVAESVLGVRLRPDDRHGADLEEDEEGRALQILVTTITESLGHLCWWSAWCSASSSGSRACRYTWPSCSAALPWPRRRPPRCPWCNDLKTDGPVTRTLIPMAALDDLVGALVFFLVIAAGAPRTSPRRESRWLGRAAAGVPAGLHGHCHRVCHRASSYALTQDAGTALWPVMAADAAALRRTLASADQSGCCPSPVVNFMLHRHVLLHCLCQHD